MPRIANNQRLFGNDFPASAQAGLRHHAAQSVRQRIIGNRQQRPFNLRKPPAQYVYRRQRRDNIYLLVAPPKVDVRLERKQVAVGHQRKMLQVAALFRVQHPQEMVGIVQRSVLFPRRLLKDRRRFAMPLPYQHRHVRLYDARFFAGNGFERITQMFRVIHPHIGDDAQHRPDNIGGIEAPAHAGFNHSNVYVLPRKVFQRQRRSHLKE